MARRRLKKSNGSSGRLITPGRVGVLLGLAAALWLASGFATKIVVAYRLNAEVAQMQRDTQHLEDVNRGYQSQLSALAQPGGKEEQERLHNYIQRDEKVYVIPQPSPAPSARPSPASDTSGNGPTRSGGFWQDLWGAVTSALH